MKTILYISGGFQVEYDPVLGGFGDRSAPCFQCGTCCSRWQAPVNSNEVRAIAANLGIPIDKFYSEYTRTYPVRPDSYLLAHKDGGCVFLKHEGRRALCSIHDFRPVVCRDWTPSLSRKECREGLARLGEPSQILKLNELNVPGDAIACLCHSLQDFGQSSIMDKQEETLFTMNKTKRVAAHKHRAHIRKTKEKRRLALGPAGMAAEAAKRRAPKKETETGISESRRKPVAVTDAAHADKSAVAKEKPHKEHKPAKKHADVADNKTATDSQDAQARKARPAKAAVKTDKPETAVETPPASEHHKAKKPKTDSEA